MESKEVPKQYIDMMETIQLENQDGTLVFKGLGMQINLYAASKEVLFSKKQGITIKAALSEGKEDTIHLSAMNGFVEVDYSRQNPIE